MGNAKLKNSLPAVLTIPERDAEALLRAGDGDAALLYIYVLRQGGRLDREAAARELGRSDRDMAMAADRLMQLGLIFDAENPSVPSAGEELPEYEGAEIARRSMEDEQFRMLVDELQRSLGRTFSRTDLNRLYAIYEEYSLPAEVIMLLVQYCKDESVRRYGPGRTVGMGFVCRVAREWFDLEIMTYERAEEWLRMREERRSQYGRLRQALGFKDREPTKTERGYIDAWLDLGFSPEAVAAAAERTITNTGGMKWRYCDAIIRDWNEKGLHSLQEIEQGDQKPGKRKIPAPEKPARDDKKAMEQIRRLKDKMNGGTS